MKPSYIIAVLAIVPTVVTAQYNYQATTVSPSPTPVSSTVTPVSSATSPTPSPQEAQADYYLKIKGVEGESEETAPSPTPQEAHADYFLKIEGIEGESEETKESGEKNGTADINIGVGELASDLEILFGDENAGEASTDEGDPDRPVIAGIILEGMQEEGVPVEHISLNFERIRTTVRQEVRLFGFIPVDTTVDVDIDAQGRIKVKFPWWAFLARGIDSDDLGSRIALSLSDVLKARHDAVMGSIQNTR